MTLSRWRIRKSQRYRSRWSDATLCTPDISVSFEISLTVTHDENHGADEDTEDIEH